MAESHDHVSCSEVVELVTDYLEGAMSPEHVERFEYHLSLCDACVCYVDQIRMTIAAVGRIGNDDVPPEIRDNLVVAFRDFKRQP
jgi:anti-sigma factor (TIGR02949 family)